MTRYAYVLSAYKYSDEKGRYRLLPLLNPNDNRPNLTYEFLGVTRVWRWTKERMQKSYEEGLVVQLKPGSVPQYKKYLSDSKGRTITNHWSDIPQTAGKESLGYPTQKPEALLERIIKASSNEGDVILDAYCGCGTTIAVAERLQRNWIGIDITYQSISLMLKRLEDSFGKNVLDNVILNGIPKDMESAQALALKKDDRTRKEFEKWAVLTYSNNRAVINAKKGADKGIDAIAYFRSEKDDPERIILQVKSGKVSSRDIRDLQGTITRENATLGIFITLQKPTKDMIKEAKEAGIYQSQYMSAPVDTIRIVTIQEIIEEQKRLDILLALEVLKSAEKQRDNKSIQIQLEL